MGCWLFQSVIGLFCCFCCFWYYGYVCVVVGFCMEVYIVGGKCKNCMIFVEVDVFIDVLLCIVLMYDDVVCDDGFVVKFFYVKVFGL